MKLVPKKLIHHPVNAPDTTYPLDRLIGNYLAKRGPKINGLLNKKNRKTISLTLPSPKRRGGFKRIPSPHRGEG